MLQVDFINVGDGDAILLQDFAPETPYRMLVDCGRGLIEYHSGSRQQYAVNFLMRRGIRELDLLVITHMHNDHFGGCLSLLPCLRIKQAVVGFLHTASERTRIEPYPELDKSVNNFCAQVDLYCDSLEALRRHRCTVSLPPEGRMQATKGLSLRFTYADRAAAEAQNRLCGRLLKGEKPLFPLVSEAAARCNNTSLVVEAGYAGRRILLPGDAYAAALERLDLPPCDLLKVSHHGDGKAVSAGLLERLRPQAAVISCDLTGCKNRPAPETIRLLRERAAWLACTENAPMTDCPAASHSHIRCQISETGGLEMAAY